MIGAVLKGMKAVELDLSREARQHEKALTTGIKVEGFRLMRLLKAEIRQGAPGGKEFSSLSFIARFYFRRRPNNPMARLAIPVRYEVTSKNPFKMAVGWVGPKTSKSWKRLAERHQEGFTSTISEKQRQWLRARLAAGTRVPKKYHKFFALRKTTTEFKTPARPMLDPFWEAYHDDAWRNIRANYHRKLRGERI